MKSGSERTQQNTGQRAEAGRMRPAALRRTRTSGLQPGPLDASPRMAAQRQRLDSAFGPAIQRQPEEEELMQGKGLALQRQPEEEEEPLQGRFTTVQRQGFEEEELQTKAAPSPLQRQPEQPAGAAGGLPEGLRAGIESLSGFDLSDVRVHANSAKPAEIGALAYAQGNDIHLGPGQQKHLPHEAWHLVQQRQGRVKPTMQTKGVAINNDSALEREADAMGQKAIQRTYAATAPATLGGPKDINDHAMALDQPARHGRAEKGLLQGKILIGGEEKDRTYLFLWLVRRLNVSTPDGRMKKEIMGAWRASRTEHKFKTHTRLMRALERAADMRQAHGTATPNLYRKSNLKFTTKASGRKATLYFTMSGQTGRLRQQHGRGPYAAIDAPPKVRIFLKNESARDDFLDVLENSRVVYGSAARRIRAAKQAAGRGNWSDTPKSGYKLVEYDLAGEFLSGLHISGGKVETGIFFYTDRRISNIYKKIVGLS